MERFEIATEWKLEPGNGRRRYEKDLEEGEGGKDDLNNVNKKESITACM